MNKSLNWILLFIIPIVASCIIIPVPTGEKDPFEEDIKTIQTGVTTKTEVINLLGPPNKFYSEEYLSLYSYDKHDLDFYWGYIIPFGASMQGTSGGGKVESHHLIYMAILFDDKDYVKKILKKRFNKNADVTNRHQYITN